MGRLTVNPAESSANQGAQELLTSLTRGGTIMRTVNDYSPWPFSVYEGSMSARTSLIIQAAGELGTALQTTILPENSETIEQLDSLNRRRPVFQEVAKEHLAPWTNQAADLFQADRTGIALRIERLGRKRTDTQPGKWSTFDTFPALERNGRTYRILRGGASRFPTIAKAFGTLALPSEAKLSESNTYVITELVTNGERPSEVTPGELEDWLDRLRMTEVEVGLDIGDEGDSLDNFLRCNDQLYWCDGSLMGVKPLNPDRIDAEVHSWRSAMQRFVKDPPA